MRLLISKEKCTGCFACLVACNQNAIEIKKDVLGNLYPEINEKRCVNCRKCQSVCPEQSTLVFRDILKAYAVWSLDSESRQTSASGGAAAEFYAEAISKDGWICGAEYSNDGRVIHTLSKDKDAIQRYKQSKYVYSEAHAVFRTIRELLNKGEKVLFISLPCKIAGLVAYLGKEYENLILIYVKNIE